MLAWLEVLQICSDFIKLGLKIADQARLLFNNSLNAAAFDISPQEIIDNFHCLVDFFTELALPIVIVYLLEQCEPLLGDVLYLVKLAHHLFLFDFAKPFGKILRLTNGKSI